MFDLTPRRLAAIAGTAITFLIPVAADHAPGELLAKLQPYSPFFFGLATIAAYFLGVDHGRQHLSTAETPSTGVAVTKVGALRSAIYQVRELTDVVLEPGRCRYDAAKSLMIKLGRENTIWHDQTSVKARNSFLQDVRIALDIRTKNGNRLAGIVGDFNDGQRKTFAGKLTQRSRILVDALEVQLQAIGAA